MIAAVSSCPSVISCAVAWLKGDAVVKTACALSVIETIADSNCGGRPARAVPTATIEFPMSAAVSGAPGECISGRARDQGAVDFSCVADRAELGYAARGSRHIGAVILYPYVARVGEGCAPHSRLNDRRPIVGRGGVDCRLWTVEP